MPRSRAACRCAAKLDGPKRKKSGSGGDSTSALVACSDASGAMTRPGAGGSGGGQRRDIVLGYERQIARQHHDRLRAARGNEAACVAERGIQIARVDDAVRAACIDRSGQRGVGRHHGDAVGPEAGNSRVEHVIEQFPVERRAAWCIEHARQAGLAERKRLHRDDGPQVRLHAVILTAAAAIQVRNPAPRAPAGPCLRCFA